MIGRIMSLLTLIKEESRLINSSTVLENTSPKYNKFALDDLIEFSKDFLRSNLTGMSQKEIL